jgi:hypothetical protein
MLILILVGVAAVELAPSLGLAEPSPALRGARIPQYDPFDLGPPPFEDTERDLAE